MLVLIVAYEAEEYVSAVIRRIPFDRLPVGTEILVLDDASTDQTVGKACEVRLEVNAQMHVMKNPKNLGYGGNQKLGYRYAIDEGFDAVAMLHGDGQYAPECLPEILRPLLSGEAEAVMGSRMMVPGSALSGGMPIYKWIGNKVLTTFENWITGLSLSEFHSGFRAYSTGLLRRIPFEYNSNEFHFDTEILIQIKLAGNKITEVPIPTHYGNEVCRVNGWQYFFNCIKACLRSWLTSKGLFYSRRFDVRNEDGPYESKIGIPHSSHEVALSLVPNNSAVLDIGGGNGWLADELVKAKGCDVCILDNFFRQNPPLRHKLLKVDLTLGLPRNLPDSETVVLLDVLEHLVRPAQVRLLDAIRNLYGSSGTKLVVCVPNTAFFPIRLVFLFFGKLNYGRRGILDETHAFLFTKSSLRTLLEESEFEILSFRGLPPPYGFAFGKSRITNSMSKIHSIFARALPSAFGYQFIVECVPRPTPAQLLVKSRSSEVKNQIPPPLS